VAVVSRGPGSLDVVVVRYSQTPARLWRRAWSDSAWQAWEDLGKPQNVVVNPGQSPAAVAPGNGRLDVFFVAGGGVVYRKQWTGRAGWGAWQSLGAPPAGAVGIPSLSETVVGGVAVIVRGVDGAVYVKSYKGSGIGGAWQNLAGGTKPGGLPFTSVTRGSGSLEVFAAADDLQLNYKWFNFHAGSGGWHPSQAGWDLLAGGVLTSPFSLRAVKSGPRRLDVFFEGTAATSGTWLLHKWQDLSQGPQWHEGELLKGANVSLLQAVSWGPNRIDLFSRGGGGLATGSVYHRGWDGSAWSPAPDAAWEDMGGEFYVGCGPGAVSWGPNRLDVFMVPDKGVDKDANVWHRWWDGAAWTPHP
jgi:hypothetical protein